jgi:hypothetical protein
MDLVRNDKLESTGNKLGNMSEAELVQFGKALQDKCKADQQYLVELEEGGSWSRADGLLIKY